MPGVPQRTFQQFPTGRLYRARLPGRMVPYLPAFIPSACFARLAVAFIVPTYLRSVFCYRQPRYPFLTRPGAVRTFLPHAANLRLLPPPASCLCTVRWLYRHPFYSRAGCIRHLRV